MKNLKFFLFSFFNALSPPMKITSIGLCLTICTFFACQKENVNNVDKTTGSSSTIQEFRINTDPLEKLVLNSDDKAAEFINKSNVEISQVLLELVTRKDINKFIVETAKANEGNVSYEQIFKQIPEIEP